VSLDGSIEIALFLRGWHEEEEEIQACRQGHHAAAAYLVCSNSQVAIQTMGEEAIFKTASVPVLFA
jgi:sugar/nucleoside kinase (ribokinase family)